MLEKIRELMNENAIDWLLVFSEDPHLSEYTAQCDRYRAALSGFTGSAGTLLIGAGEAYLWTDSRYFIQAAEELAGSGIELMKANLPATPSLETFLTEHVWDGQRIALDHMTLSYDRFVSLTDVLPDSVEVTDGRKILRDAVSMPSRAFHQIDSVPVSFAGRSVSQKLDDLRKKIKKTCPNIEGYTYIISDLTSVMWLFNLRGSDIEHVPVAYSYACVNEHYATLYVSRKHLDEETIGSLDVADVNIKEYSLFYKDLEDIPSILLADRCTCNSAIISGAAQRGMYVECEDQLLIGKSIKCEQEMDGARSAHIKDAVTMIRFIKHVKELAASDERTDEYELACMLDEARKQNGAENPSFSTICAYRQNSSIVHYSPRKDTAGTVEGDGFLLVDSGGQYRFEGTTDITRTISLGHVTDEERKVYTTVLKGNLRLMDTVFPQGYEGTMLDAIAEQPLWDAGYFCGHGIGHGVGAYLSVHESEARIARRTGKREITFRPGVIVSNEPGIYLEGKFGVRLENLLLVVPAESIDGYKMCAFEPLTLVPFDKEAIDFKMLTKKETDILARYYGLIYEKVSPHLNDEEKQWLKEIIDIK